MLFLDIVNVFVYICIFDFNIYCSEVEKYYLCDYDFFFVSRLIIVVFMVN